MSTHWHFGMASSMSLSGHEDDCTACIVTTADKEAGDPQCIWTIQKCSQLCLAASRSIITELPPSAPLLTLVCPWLHARLPARVSTMYHLPIFSLHSRNHE